MLKKIAKILITIDLQRQGTCTQNHFTQTSELAHGETQGLTLSTPITQVDAPYNKYSSILSTSESAIS